MKISRKSINQTALFLAATFVLSSCSRGYGCPSNFSIGDFLLDAGKAAVQAAVQFIF